MMPSSARRGLSSEMIPVSASRISLIIHHNEMLESAAFLTSAAFLPPTSACMHQQNFLMLLRAPENEEHWEHWEHIGHSRRSSQHLFHLQNSQENSCIPRSD